MRIHIFKNYDKRYENEASNNLCLSIYQNFKTIIELYFIRKYPRKERGKKTFYQKKISLKALHNQQWIIKGIGKERSNPTRNRGHPRDTARESCTTRATEKERERRRSCFWRKVDRCGGTINRPVEYRLRGRHDCHYYRCSLPVSVNMAVGLWRPGLSTNAPGGRCTMHRRGQDADFEIGKCKVAVQPTNPRDAGPIDFRDRSRDRAETRNREEIARVQREQGREIRDREEDCRMQLTEPANFRQWFVVIMGSWLF